MNFTKKITVFVFLLLVVLTDYSIAETKDCFEKVNRKIFSFNKTIDNYFFKPIATGYSYLPAPIKSGIRNITSNISYTVTIPNHLLQGEFKNFTNDTGRFIINSTFGILGIFDPAATIGLKKIEYEDYGQTLGKWGVESGCFIMLPILGPSTTRDTVGKIANTILDPFYMVTVGNKTFMENNFGDKTYYLEKGFDTVDFRYQNLNNFDSLEKNSIDYYASIRSLYLQKRENLIKNNFSAEDEWKNFK